MIIKEDLITSCNNNRIKNEDLQIVQVYNFHIEGEKTNQKKKNSKISVSFAINVINYSLYKRSVSNLKEIARAKTVEIKGESHQQEDNEERNIVEKTLLNQIGDINIRLLLDGKKEDERDNLPKVEFIELTLLNQSLFSISKFKKYGFAIYVFFFYLRNLLFTFFVLFGFAFYYMYCIFFKYYPHVEDEYSLFSDYNLLTLVSGVQIIRYRKYYINEYGKEAFLEKYKNFDVFYKEYFYSATILLIFSFLVNFFLIIYLIRKYESYKLKHQDHFNLILSGDIIDDIKSQESKKEKIEIKINYEDNETEKALAEKKILDEAKNEKEEVEKEEGFTEEDKRQLILRKLALEDKKEDVDIDFTFKLSEYYEKIEEIKSYEKEYIYLHHRVTRNKCCCCCRCCCCFCWRCFKCCCCPCCNKSRIREVIKNKNKEELIRKLEAVKFNECNPLYIIKLKNKRDYENLYDRYPSYYITNCLKNFCRYDYYKNHIYINKAPRPEDIVWENLEFQIDEGFCGFFSRKFCIFLTYLVFILFSAVFNIIGDRIDKLCEKLGDKIHDLFNNEFFMMLANILVSYALEKVGDCFEDCILDGLKEKTNFWSYSDIKYYYILHKSIFKFINQGIIPYATYILFEKVICKKNEDDYSNLVSKMFVILEMDGFGYPLIDLFLMLYKKFKEMKRQEKKEMNRNNVQNEIINKLKNEEGRSQYELHKAHKRRPMKLDENYADILSIYWITMFYLPIYPIGIIQSFLNLLFKFIMEKNFLTNVYRRPEYIEPHFGFFCFNFFNFGFFLVLLGNLLFFQNEDNKSSFGNSYIIFMIIILIFPSYYIAKFLTNCCCGEKVRIDFNFIGEITKVISSSKDDFKDIINKYLTKLSLTDDNKIFRVNSPNGTEISPKEEKPLIEFMNDINKQTKRIEVFVSLSGFKETNINNDKLNLNENRADNINININANNNINKKRVNIDIYKVLNPYYQKNQLIEIFSKFKNNNLLTQKQFDFLKNKVDTLDRFELYKIQQKMKVPKHMKFEEKRGDSIFDDPIKDVNDSEKKKLYYFLIQLGFLTYKLNLSPRIKFNYKRGEEIKSESLRNLSKQENLVNNKIDCYTIFNIQEKINLAYVENKNIIQIFDIVDRRLLETIPITIGEEILCIKVFTKLRYGKEDLKIPKLVALTDNNNIVIYDLSKEKENKEEKIIKNIGDSWDENKKEINNIFSLSTVQHGKKTWIITSYYYDKYFKIYDVDEERESIFDIVPINNQEFNDYIISLEGFYFTEQNTFILVRSTDGYKIRINLFINHYFIKKLIEVENAYVNSKTIQIQTGSSYLIITKIKKDLSSYDIQIIDLTNIFNFNPEIIDFSEKFKSANFINSIISPLLFWLNENKNIELNENNKYMLQKINKNIPPIYKFSVDLGNNILIEQRDEKKIFIESNEEQYNIGNILFWETNYILVGTPFGLDVLDFRKGKKVCTINLNDNQFNDIIYDLSEKLNDKEYGPCFLLRDFNSRIKYIRPSSINEDSGGYRILQFTDNFNDLEREIKLNRFKQINIFYLFYTLISFLLPLVAAFLGRYKTFNFKFPYLIVLTVCYGLYAILGIGFKGFVYDINEGSKTYRIIYKTIYIILIVVKACANTIFSFWFCKVNKTGFIFVICLFSVYLIHLLIYFVIYLFRIIPLKTYFITNFFYQLSRACIFIFFIISIFFEFNHVETYYYAAALCIIQLYMFMADYFNILMKDIVYNNNYIQAIFNYPMEWMNLLCCWCITPKDLIRKCDITYYLVVLFFPLLVVLYIDLFLGAIVIGLVVGIFLLICDLICLPCS